MPLRKTPSADLKRQRPVTLQIGLVLSLGLAVLAFTVDLPESEAAPYVGDDAAPIELEEIPPTQEYVPPPPPPPPAPPPPQEVPDDEEVADEIAEVVIDFADSVPARPAPPPQAERAVAPPPTVTVAPPPPPPPPTVDRVEIFEVAEVQPELIGGLAGLQGRVEYPELARRVGIEGQVIIQFVVDERGAVVDPVVLRSPNDLLAEAALKAVRESRFAPGQQRGRPVKVRFAVPVTFRLR